MPPKTRQVLAKEYQKFKETSHELIDETESQPQPKKSRSLSTKKIKEMGQKIKEMEQDLKDMKQKQIERQKAEKKMKNQKIKENTQKLKEEAKLQKDIAQFEQNKIQAKAKVKAQAEVIQENQSVVVSLAQEKKQIVKGSAAVDEYVDDSQLFHVLCHQGIVYDCLMNQTNIMGQNNNNKFYIVQVLETDSSPQKYYIYNRWGRVGKRGQNIMMEYTIDECIHDFEKKVSQKNVKGGYKIIEKDYSLTANDNDLQLQLVDDFTTSKLEMNVKSFIQLIFDMKMMNQQMHEIGYDPSKMPLGKIASKTLQQGYKILQELSIVINKKPLNKVKLELLTSDFYSYIPHNFGFQKAPIIKSMEDIKTKLEMLASLEQIQVATRLLEKKGQGNLIDDNYLKLQSTIVFVDTKSKEYELISDYLFNTQGSTHTNYTLVIQQVFKVRKELDDQRHKSKLGNRMLLWHGSRLSNYAGILSQGLRIAPPEAPVTGYMFGKGVYFADMVSKSANYCGASTHNPFGCILLCDVALGEMNDKFEADYQASDLPEGKHSTRGCGQNAPPLSTYINFEDMQIPIGKGEKTNVQKTSLLYNEYIVYDVAQIRLKYIVKLQFNYV